MIFEYSKLDFSKAALSCVKIQGYLLKIINPLTLGQIKLCMDPVNKNLKKKIQNYDL